MLFAESKYWIYYGCIKIIPHTTNYHKATITDLRSCTGYMKYERMYDSDNVYELIAKNLYCY